MHGFLRLHEAARFPRTTSTAGTVERSQESSLRRDAFPGAVAGSLAQWRVVCADTEGRTSVHPEPAAKDDVRSYGTLVAGAPLNTTLPVLHWFTLDPDKATSREGLQVSASICESIYVTVNILPICEFVGEST